MTSWAARAKVHLLHKAHAGTDETDKTPISSVLSVHTGALYEKRVSANDPIPAPETRGEPTSQIGDAAFTEAVSDPDRHCWPHTEAMNGREIDTFTARLILFTGKGVTHTDAEQLADKLVARDRQQDDRRHCLECRHLAGYGAWRCKNWIKAEVAIQERDAALPSDFVRLFQHCNGFGESVQSFGKFVESW